MSDGTETQSAVERLLASWRKRARAPRNTDWITIASTYDMFADQLHRALEEDGVKSRPG